MAKPVAIVAFLLLPFGQADGQSTNEPLAFFTEQIGLTADQISSITAGDPVVKILHSKNSSELFVFGAVFVNAKPEGYAPLAFDMQRLRNSPNYLGVGRISDPPQFSDFAGFTLEPEDIASLKACTPGKCGVQLPAGVIRETRAAGNVAQQANHRIQTMALNLVRDYQQSGNRVLGTYGDSEDPFDVNAELRALLGRSRVLPVYLPDLDRYLLDYPNAKLPGSQSVFFWERVNFGLKPTLRVNHGIAYRSEGPRGAAQVVVVKQLYASHYLQLAIDLTVCVPAPGRNGFYLISLKGSTQQGLTGFTGSILKRIIQSRTRSAQERMLWNIKRSMEHKP
jgi:hypothetical protein